MEDRLLSYNEQEDIIEELSDYNKDIDRLKVFKLLNAYEEQKRIIERESDNYESAFRALAKDLLPKWIPWEFEGKSKSQNSWGAGLDMSLYSSENKDKGIVSMLMWDNEWDSTTFAKKKEFSLDQMRIHAISVLVFCEAEEWRKQKENG